MKNLIRFAAVLLACLCATPARAQNTGTVTNHAFPIGKGAGQQGFTSLLCAAGSIPIGQTGADPICQSISGDITISAAGVAAIGATKVTSAMLNADVYSTAHTWSANQTLTINQATSTNWTINNNSAGVSAAAAFNANNGTGLASVGIGGTGYTAQTGLQNRAFLFGSSTSAGIALWADGANPINFYNSGSLAGSFSSAGIFSLTTPLALTSGGVGSGTASGARTTLGLVIGTDVQAQDADLSALAANSTTGFWAYTGAGTGAARTFTAPAAGFTITNPAGTAGNPTFVLANDLAALEGLSGTGIARRTGTDAWSVGTAVSNSELATMGAFTLKGNNTSGAATPTDVDISALTSKPSPVSADIVLIQDSAASNAFKRTTVGALASAGSVASLNGSTGAVTFSVVKQMFTASGTYTPTTGMDYAIIECVGSGAGGGGTTGTVGSLFTAGGGGAGSYSRSVVTAAAVGASQVVTVGAAGSGGAAGSNNGTGGGDVAVGSLCIAKGGSLGGFSASGTFGVGGVGGIAGTGDLTIPGGAGASGIIGAGTTVVFSTGGVGGNSYLGAGGLQSTPVSGASANGVAGSNYGAGGSGGHSHNIATTSAGGNGSKGVVFITEFIVN